jgi:membrane protein
MISLKISPKFTSVVRGGLREFVGVLGASIRQVREADVQILAGSLAFATVISLIPLLAVSLSVFNAYGGFESLISKIEPFILQNLVEASGTEASRYIRRGVSRIHSSTLGIGGIVALLFTSTKLFHDVETAVQRVWRLRSQRSLLKRLIVYWLVIFAGPLVLAVALGIIGSKDLNLLRLLPKDLIGAVFTFVAFFAINKYAPAAKVSAWSAFVGSLTATIAMAIAQEFYSVAMSHLFKFGKVYGSLASVPVLMIWIYVCWWISLVGVAVTATLEKRRPSNLSTSLIDRSANVALYVPAEENMDKATENSSS